MTKGKATHAKHVDKGALVNADQIYWQQDAIEEYENYCAHLGTSEFKTNELKMPLVRLTTNVSRYIVDLTRAKLNMATVVCT